MINSVFLFKTVYINTNTKRDFFQDPEAKPNYKQQTNKELEKIQQKTILLYDMLNNVKVGERIGVGDMFEVSYKHLIL